MFGTKFLIDKLNTLIAGGGLSDLQLAQASGAVDMLIRKGVASVATVNDLPNPVTNKGRFFFIRSENRYVFSNGVTWNINNIIKSPTVNLYSWGSSYTGQLGDGTTVSKSSPVSVIGGFSNWVQATGGQGHSVGIRTNGTLWAWGRNQYGQLGDNTTTSKRSPVSVVGGFTDWVQVSCGITHSIGVRANGTIWGFGRSDFGQLGNNSNNPFSRISPVSVVGGFTDWVQVAAGSTHCVALRANGTAWAWGNNGTSGVAGNNTTTNSFLSPVSVAGGFTDWVQVGAGFFHSLGIRANGTAWAWGMNSYCQLGDNTTTTKSSPVSIVGGFTDWVQLTGGENRTIGLRANGTLWRWGGNASGPASPVSVVGGFTDWVQVAAGGSHTLGVRANGTLWAWDGNASGQLGTGDTFDRASPVSVIGGFTDWIHAGAGHQHSLGVRG